MRGGELPSQTGLRKAMDALQWGGRDPRPPNAPDLCRWARWTRIDARLAEVFVRFLAGSFRSINPFELRDANQSLPQPQVLATLAEFAHHRLARKGSADQARDLRAWIHVLTKDLEPASPQMFFVSQGAPRPERDLRKAESSLKPYRRWGYLGNESLSDGKAETARTLLGKSERFAALERLLETHATFSISDYIRACGGRVHRRTAQRDLLSHPALRGRGYTRAKLFGKILPPGSARRLRPPTDPKTPRRGSAKPGKSAGKPRASTRRRRKAR